MAQAVPVSLSGFTLIALVFAVMAALPFRYPFIRVTDGMYLKYWIFNFEIEDVIIPLNINPNPQTLLYPIFEKNKKYFFATKKAELMASVRFSLFVFSFLLCLFVDYRRVRVDINYITIVLDCIIHHLP